MADRLTQLQDCLDDLATQMFASLRYIQTHHSYGNIEGQPDQDPHHPSEETTVNGNSNRASATNGAVAAAQAQGAANDTRPVDINATEPQEPVPDRPDVFQAALRELARDLIMKEQQIEHLISVLPGIGTSERDQDARIQALEGELKKAEEQRKEAMQERSQMLALLGELASSCKRIY